MDTREASHQVVGALNEQLGTKLDTIDAKLFEAVICAASEDKELVDALRKDGPSSEAARGRLALVMGQVVTRQRQIFTSIMRGGDFARVVRSRLCQDIFRGIQAEASR